MSRLVKLPFRYEVVRSSGRRTLAIEVHPDQSVVVRAPADCPDDVIAERLDRRSRWVLSKLREFELYKPKTPPRQYLSGETHLYLGRQYRLRVITDNVGGVKLLGGYLQVMASSSSPELVKRILTNWYRDRAKEVFSKTLQEAQKRFRGISSPTLSIRKMRSRWGSLSRNGTMTLNLELIRAPKACIEYVVIHELCHLRHPAHDASYYRHLSKLLSDWQRRKARLERVLL